MSESPGAESAPRPALVRDLQRRELAGVCAALATHLRLDVRAVRLFFIAATPFGGAGALVYAFLWITLAGRTTETSPPGTAPGPARRIGLPSAFTVLCLVAALLFTVALTQVAIAVGWDLNLHIWLPLAVVSVGVLFVWGHLDETTRTTGDPDLPGVGIDSPTAVRLAVGVVLTLLGLVLLLTTGRSWGQVATALMAALVVLAGIVVLVTPWMVRLWRDLRAEQAERVRATERADIAAHLHDSVLQTLALIQRNSEDAGRVSRLARAQERELRRWLFTDTDPESDTLVAAVREVAAEVEDSHGIPVEVVVTGDRRTGEGERALIAAVREALVNAARHGGPPVSAYLEVGPGAIAAFVRDHGPGFDLESVPGDRLGVRESIIGRMSRAGGRAAIRRLENGTEVHLHLPVAPGRTADRASPAEKREYGAPSDSQTTSDSQSTGAP